MKELGIRDVPGLRHGHNEQDSPHATLPLTYARIQQHPRVLDVYAARLHARGLTTPSLLADMQAPACSPALLLLCPVARRDLAVQ